MTSLARSFRQYLLSPAIAAITGLGLGCVITTGAGNCDECGGIACNSQSAAGDTCVCDPGYEWEDPNDNNNFECNRIPPKSGECDDPNSQLVGDECFCDDGYNWCSDNPDDLSCCVDDQQGPGGTGQNPGDTGNDTANGGSETAGADGTTVGADGTTGGGLACEETPAAPTGVEPNDADCTKDGLVFCSNTEAEGPTGSRYYLCMGGAWTDSPAVADEICVFDGFDFALGCTDDGVQVNVPCGVGPGTDCSGPECDGCLDSDIIQTCTSNKLSEDSCARICQDVGDARGITYDTGTCEVDADGSVCACCDDGDEGCVV